MQIGDGDQSLVAQRLAKLEENLAEQLRQVRETLALNQQVVQFFGDALKAYRERCLREVHADGSTHLVEKIRRDTELGFPHRKILDCLLSQYDFESRQFREVHFSKLVREAHVGKNRANSYLALLEQKGYIKRREDGYRKFFRILG